MGRKKSAQTSIVRERGQYYAVRPLGGVVSGNKNTGFEDG